MKTFNLAFDVIKSFRKTPRNRTTTGWLSKDLNKNIIEVNKAVEFLISNNVIVQGPKPRTPDSKSLSVELLEEYKDFSDFVEILKKEEQHSIIEEIAYRILIKSLERGADQAIKLDYFSADGITLTTYDQAMAFLKAEQLVEKWRNNREFGFTPTGEKFARRGGVPTVQSKIISSNQDLRDEVFRVIETELEHKVRNTKFWSMFWDRDKPKKEPESQIPISTILSMRLNSNGIDLTTEPEEANGNVDIRMSCTNMSEVYKTCIELKNADHPNIEKKAGTQLTAYLDSIKSRHGIYLVLWHKSNGKYKLPTKYNTPEDLKIDIENNIPANYDIKVKVLDCTQPIPPSKKKS